MNPFGKMDGREHSIQWLDREHNVDRLSLAGMLLGGTTSEVEKRNRGTKQRETKALIGICFATAYVVARSLWWVIIAHIIMISIYGDLFTRRLRRLAMEARPAP
jgi:hypothetical protein